MSFDSRIRQRIFVFSSLVIVAVWFAGPFAPIAFAQEAAGDAAPIVTEDSLIVHIVKSAGIVFGPLLLFLSMALVALVILLGLDLRMQAAIPPAFVQQFTDTVNQRKFKEAFELARADQSFLAKVLAGGMSRLQYGIEDARDAALNMVDSIRASKEQINNYTAVICSLGPLIGLVGTVFGMILSFKELAKSGKGVDAARVADGISHALVITMLGIGIAVPGLFFNAFFRNRITRISMDVANIADDLLTQMYHSTKKQGVSIPAPVSVPSNGGTTPTPAPTA